MVRRIKTKPLFSVRKKCLFYPCDHIEKRSIQLLTHVITINEKNQRNHRPPSGESHLGKGPNLHKRVPATIRVQITWLNRLYLSWTRVKLAQWVIELHWHEQLHCTNPTNCTVRRIIFFLVGWMFTYSSKNLWVLVIILPALWMNPQSK